LPAVSLLSSLSKEHLKDRVMRNFLRRYTNLPALIYLLREQKITLLDPETWVDTNDSSYMTIYKKKKSLTTVLALCFSQASETFHHWRVFADGASGICILFRRDDLLKALAGQSGVRHREVKYLKITDQKKVKLKTNRLPFAKRYPYGDEKEYRVIYESKTADKIKSLDIPISLSCICEIKLSPWMPPALRSHVISTIRDIKDCDDLEIGRSTLISNERWKKLGEAAR
jgi:hypothetical protein